MLGTIDVITGPMFSGKSAELIRRLQIHTIAEKRIKIYKHASDTRFGKPLHISSRNGTSITSVPTDNAQLILDEVVPEDLDMLAIDEIQFFDAPELIPYCKKLADEHGLHIIICGLDMDYRGIPFDMTAKFMAIADSVYKTRAVCMQCRNTQAIYTHKLSGNNERLEVGSDNYEPRCRSCK